MSKGNNLSTENIPAEFLALGPLDGRYSQISKKLAPYFSEYALVKNRVHVEVEWLVCLMKHLKFGSRLGQVDESRIPDVLSISQDFNGESFARVKQIEATTNHDVKSVELFVAEKLKEMGLDILVSFVHIGCTSEDITNTAYAIMIKTALEEVWYPAADKLINKICQIAKNNAYLPMLAHTHGQPATPTTVGKEFAVYVYRLRESLKNIKSIKVRAKFNGATGNYAAISTVFPEHDWPGISKRFIEDYFGLDFNPVTTQIESHDYMCHLADGIRHFNNVLLDLDLDMWLYISMDYFKQIPVNSEVGSSTMPHKVNPIRFENSEANIDMSNAIFMALSNKLPRSRMQRDLSDSSSQRNIGLAFGYSLQAIEQSTSGLEKVVVNAKKISSDLSSKWEVLAEPIQTMLRKYGRPNAYNMLKELTRGKEISAKEIQQFIQSLDTLPPDENGDCIELRWDDLHILMDLTPENYTGLADKITESVLNME